jgi:hypothetical protein
MRDPDTRRSLAQTDKDTRHDPHAAHDDGFDEEEKLLAGKHDVNMPALLTRDVKGG